mmetsp:Transcript_37320/g.47964  ORF Transcript_37320/g.47964 Transcript_37320/m.47964 type:complete len:116 (+) Transcript_37320:173-520(+)
MPRLTQSQQKLPLDLNHKPTGVLTSTSFQSLKGRSSIFHGSVQSGNKSLSTESLEDSKNEVCTKFRSRCRNCEMFYYNKVAQYDTQNFCSKDCSTSYQIRTGVFVLDGTVNKNFF